MLSSLKHQRLYDPCRLLRVFVRSLNTTPRRLPFYIESWDPTQHAGLQPPSSSPDTYCFLRDARRLQRKRLLDKTKFFVFTRLGSECNSHSARKLDELLRLADSNKGTGKGNELWHAYLMAKEWNPGLISALTDTAWRTLLASQPSKSQLRRRTIVQDKIRAGARKATPKLRSAGLERMMLEGNHTKALEEWENDHFRDESASRTDHMPDHLELGVKLYALAGNADRARDTMEELFELYPDWNPSIMMHVFRVHTDTNSDHHREEAWNIYQQMLRRAKGRPTLDEYDSWFVGFLEARHDRYARQVFRDMIEAKALDLSSPSTEIVEGTLRRLELLSRLGTDILKITDICILAIRMLPSSYHSHIYLKWMASAVRFNAPNQISRILETMTDRGRQPHTLHFNLVLKALFRTGENPWINKAEDIGWRMIEEARQRQLKERKSVATPIIDGVERNQGVEPEPTDSAATKKYPSADATTYAIIMQHHASRNQWEQVDYLSRRLEESDMEPNDSLMNILISNCTRKAQYVKAWTIYKNLTNIPVNTPKSRISIPQVFPDGTAIRYIWRNLRLALSNGAVEESRELPTPRELLVETIGWWKQCKSRPDAAQFLSGLAMQNKTGIANLILHCFNYTEDFVGSLVALHVLRKEFGIYPTPDTARTLQGQAAWAETPKQSQTGNYHAHSQLYQQSLSRMGRVYEILADKTWQEKGYDSDDERTAHLSADTVGEIELNILSGFIRTILKRSYPPDMIEDMIMDAKVEVGVQDMSTGDLDAFSVP